MTAAPSAERSGRTLLVTKDGFLFFQQFKGDENSASGPPHDQLRKAANIGFERILAGGAVTDQSVVKWMSGTCQLGFVLKRAVNDVIVSDETKKALRNIGKSDLQIADADIRRVVLQHWEASSSTCCSFELSEQAMYQIRAATDVKHEI